MINTKRDILWRVYLLYLLMLVFGVAIMGKLVYIQVYEGEALLQKAEKQEIRAFNIPASRGNILSDDESLLATSVPMFELRMDVSSPHISDALFQSKVDSLARGLSVIFPGKSSHQFKQTLIKARKSGNRYLLLDKKVSYDQLKEVRKLPILRRGKFRGGLIAIQQSVRVKPFQELAFRTIGYVKPEENLYVGLEGTYNDYLEGQAGKQLRRRINHGAWIPIHDENETEPRDGLDVVSTINVYLQDVAEHALRKHLEEHQAFQGCAILMEVSTGHIKAIANMRLDAGTGAYEESYNYAIAESVEPGSTFKTASMLALLEKTKIKLSDTIDIGKGYTTYYNRAMRDVYGIRDGRITIREAFEKSSNVGISRLVTEYFKDDPSEFTDILYEIGLQNPLNIEILGEGKPFIKNPSMKKVWYGTTLPWMSIGYELRLTPLQLLTFYNAIANGGVMVKPQFVSSIMQGGQIDEYHKTEVLQSKIASKATIDSLRSLMEGVVNNGTARLLKNDRYTIAGKTGTAQIASGSAGYNKEDYNASFVGYFPAHEPRFSCIVVVNNPSSGKIFGGAVAAPVFKEIADKAYAYYLNVYEESSAQLSADTREILPPSQNISARDLEVILEHSGSSVKKPAKGANWIKTQLNELQTLEIDPMLVPDVSKMNAKDAIYLLEELGLKVELKGKGKVRAQSLKAGSIVAGQKTISLQLSPN